ncbi:MAG TPA: bifunctional phosphopantothenoylcysteine decarboxylase/phosphopantothenate--cysteine ligase CoaBC [Levilinea sp.]|nr:bifunctional phosphopantothenoylcysteine decarboxylase/phosphopantothenate--cysteine ligase CoaBC [Levilinea sp.]
MTNPIENKNVLLGVTGSIAAYKAADLASKLTQAGALVDVILTASALKFISPLTFQSVTGRKAFTDDDLWGGEGHVTHVGLGHVGDLFIVAPATANTMARMSHGIGDNLLCVAALTARCPILIAPAMDAGMYEHPATQASVKMLRERGVCFVGPEPGHLASGLVGLGRMTEPQDILGEARYILSRGGPLAGRKIVVTAGGTQEPIDPVRMITNRSSGKQGYALAQAALDAGAEVTLITTLTHLKPPAGSEVVTVHTAADMLEAVLAHARCDTLLMAAAPADFTPAETSTQKIKKGAGAPVIRLTFAPDILLKVAEYKQKNGFPRLTIGFAAESQDLLENARKKLEEKRLDLLVANDISAANAGFEVDTNQVVLLYANRETQEFPLMTKVEVADMIIAQVVAWSAKS